MPISQRHRPSFSSIVDFLRPVVSIAVGLLCLLPFAAPAAAQFVPYPVRDGLVQSFPTEKLPRWLTLDMDLRSRPEDQTAISYKSGNEQTYELERVRGGAEFRPASWLTGYMQFHDNHVPGLPVQGR